jgi:sporulation protein YlmC with PRC-barrel domain
MKPDGRIKLVSELLDLPLIDSDGKYCGVVDDVEFDGEVGKTMRVKALLVGPGAYSGRMPGWVMALVRLVAGSRITRVSFAEIRTIGATVQLEGSGKALGLEKSEDRAERWIPHKGAL